MSSIKQTEVIWNDDTRYALGLYRQYVNLLGFWPLERNQISATVRLMIFVILQLSLTIFYIVNLSTIGYCGRILDLVEIMTIISMSSLCIVKVLVPWFQSPKMYFVLNSMVEDWAQAQNRKSHDVMMKFAYTGRTVCIFQVFITSFLIIRNILRKLPGTVSMTNSNTTAIARIVPYGPSCWVSTTMSDGYYKAYYSWICLHWLAAGITYIFIDIYIFGLGMHMCGQFELLYHDLEKIGDESCKELQKKLGNFVKRHNHLLNVADTIEDVFNLPVLMEVINNTLIISISGIILLWAIKLRSRAMGIPKLIRIYLFYVEIFMVSYVGEALSSKTEKLHEAVYNIPWYKIPTNLMKDVIVIMMRVKYPFHLTAGKVANMNYQTFTNIVKSTFSYFSVFRLFLE